MPSASRILFGDYLNVTDEGGGVIRVDGCPCDCGGTVCTPYPDATATLAATNDLRGYWRLGDGASPFLDTSGHADGAADAVKIVAGTAMTDSITGALSGADDDGAVQFNNTSGATADYLDCPDPHIPRRFNFIPAEGEEMTVTAWVKPAVSGSTFSGKIIGVWESGAFGFCGWRMGIDWPARTPFFQRRETGSSAASTIVTGSVLAADTWAFIAGTYDPTDGFKLYVNGALVDSDATVFSGMPAFNTGPNIGGPFSFCGGLDEISVWGDTLNATEIATLFESGTCVPGGGSGCEGCYELPATLPEIPATPTAQDVTDALVALGLVTQL